MALQQRIIKHSRFNSIISHSYDKRIFLAEDVYVKKTYEYLLEINVPICTSIIDVILKSKCSNWTLVLTRQAGFYPPLTSDIEVSRSGIACPIAVGGNTLILPLV